MISPKTEPSLTTKTVDDQVLVYDKRNERIHVLNTSAASVLELCDGKNTLDDIARAIKAEHEIDLDVVEKDVLGIWAEFIRLGIAAYERPAPQHLSSAVASTP